MDEYDADVSGNIIEFVQLFCANLSLQKSILFVAF
jgi:hypothetical protein